MGHYDDVIEREIELNREKKRQAFLNKPALMEDNCHADRLKWTRRFMRIAKEISTWSKDPSTKVGAIAVRDRRIIAQGYNGFPKGVYDDPKLLMDRERKYELTIHAEKNMIYNAAKEGISLQDADIYVWGLPTCSECAKALVQADVGSVTVSLECLEGDRWADSWDKAKNLYWETGTPYDIVQLDA